jgi:hypothetical protein
MQFAIIDPFKQTVEMAESKEIPYALAGLDRMRVDHGVVAPVTPESPIGLGIIVYEFGLFTPPDKQAYFAIETRLYAGAAVLYCFNKKGETVSMPGVPRVQFMPSARAVERNIELGLIERPTMSVNGVITWRWPEARDNPRRARE